MKHYDLHTVCHLGGRNQSLPLVALRVLEVGEAPVEALATGTEWQNAVWSGRTAGGPQAGTRAGGVSPLSLLTFFAAAKKVSAAPHRGDA